MLDADVVKLELPAGSDADAESLIRDADVPETYAEHDFAPVRETEAELEAAHVALRGEGARGGVGRHWHISQLAKPAKKYICSRGPINCRGG